MERSEVYHRTGTGVKEGREQRAEKGGRDEGYFEPPRRGENIYSSSLPTYFS